MYLAHRKTMDKIWGEKDSSNSYPCTKTQPKESPKLKKDKETLQRTTDNVNMKLPIFKCRHINVKAYITYFGGYVVNNHLFFIL